MVPVPGRMFNVGNDRPELLEYGRTLSVSAVQLEFVATHHVV